MNTIGFTFLSCLVESLNKKQKIPVLYILETYQMKYWFNGCWKSVIVKEVGLDVCNKISYVRFDKFGEIVRNRRVYVGGREPMKKKNISEIFFQKDGI